MNLTPLAAVLTIGLCSYGCFVDNPTIASPSADASVDSAAPPTDGGDGADAGPPLCTKYGGYSTVEKIITDLFASLLADCRISAFFTGLAPERQGHLYDCLVKQVAVVLGCPGIEYDVDNQGVECRDMRTSHQGLAIRGEDFDALVGDLVSVLANLGVSDDDVAAVAPAVLGLRDDIVTNSAPGLARPVCGGDAGR